MQRNYMLQEQLKIIKKELGIEVNSAHTNQVAYTTTTAASCRKMTKMPLLRNSGRKYKYILVTLSQVTDYNIS